MVGPSARDEFEQVATEAAHEVMGPLTTVEAAIGLVGGAIDPEDAVSLDAIALAQRQLRLARLQIARLSRLDTGIEPPVTADVDLAALARELVGDLESTVLAEHATTVESTGPVLVEVDADQIRGLLFNLLANAAKYSPAGRHVVVAVDDHRDRVELRVRDQGHGVVPDDTERIFERYERGSEHPQVSGLGLGLPLARETARAHGGDLELEPAPEDEGSTFLLTLPRGRVSRTLR